MSRGNIRFSDIFKRFKQKVGVSKDYKIAELLDFKQSTFSQRKKEGSIPYEELILYCKKHSVSLDELFAVKKTQALDFLSVEEKKYTHMAIEGLRNNRTALAIKASLDALSIVPMAEELNSVPSVPQEETQCLVCRKYIPNKNLATHQEDSPGCNLRNLTHILRLEKDMSKGDKHAEA